MAMIINNIFQLAAVASAYFLIFALIPFWLRGYRLSGMNTLDKLVGSFLYGHIAIILTTLSLSLIGIYSRFALIAALITVAVGYRFTFKRKETLRAFHNFERGLDHFIDGYYHPRVILRDIRHNISFFFAATCHKIKKPAVFAFTLLIFGYAAYIRCYHSVTNLFFGASDMYLHTEWIKLLMVNEPFTAGVYPFGFHATVAAISGLFGVNVVTVMRMFGPISGMLAVFALYYLLKRTMRSDFVINVALLLYVVSDLFPFWATERQYMALPQEFGTIFLYLTAYFLYRYMKEKRARDLFYFSAGVALTLLTHFFVTIYAALLCAAVFIACLSYVNWRDFLRIAAAVACALIVAVLPLGAGLARGIPFNASMDWALSFFMGGGGEEVAGAASSAASVSAIIRTMVDEGYFDRAVKTSLLNLNWFLPYLAAAGLALIAPVVKPRNGERRWILAAFSLYSLSVLVLFVLSVQDVFAIMEFSRLYVYYVYSIPLVICAPIELLYGLLSESGKKTRAAYLAVIGAVGVAVAGFLGAGKRFMPLGRVWQSQYNGAVQAYYDIVREFPRNQWTIVSSSSEYSLCLLDGYHYQMAKFIMDMDSGVSQLRPPTENVFVYVVKRPNIYRDTDLQYLGALTALPELDESDAYVDLTEVYEQGLLGVYRDYDANRVLQAKALSWAKEYMKYFPNEMTVYYEDDEIVVYRIEQNVYALNNFAIPYPGLAAQNREAAP